MEACFMFTHNISNLAHSRELGGGVEWGGGGGGALEHS